MKRSRLLKASGGSRSAPATNAKRGNRRLADSPLVVLSEAFSRAYRKVALIWPHVVSWVGVTAPSSERSSQ